MYLLMILLSSLATITSCDSDKVLLKFKSDVTKVEQDFENLVFDMMKKIVDNIGGYQDYYSSEEVTTRHSVTKKILDDVENTTEEYRTEETSSLKNSTHYEEILHNRLRRSVENSSSLLDQSKEVEIATISSISNDTCCVNSLELPLIDELKEEIKKLHDLVVLLRDQQKIISLLDKNSKNFDNDIPPRFGAGDVLKILDYVNTRDVQGHRIEYSSLSELSNIKNDIKEAIATLNKTKHVLAMERKKELILEKELSDQKSDISFLKMMVEKIYKNNINTVGDSDILGATQHLPKDLPVYPLAISEQNSIKRMPDESKSMIGSSARASELEDLDLERLVHKLNQPKKTDIESRISELQRELDKKNQEEDALKQLKLLEKRVEHQKKHQSDSELIKRLQTAINSMDEGKGRNLDDEIEVELQKLEDAIDNLRPSDDSDSTTSEVPLAEQSDGDMKQFQTMLKKLFSQQNRKKEDEAKRFQIMLNKMSSQDYKGTVNNPVAKEESLLLREIIELRKQLAGLGKSQFRSGYNYVPQGMFRQTQNRMEDFGNDRSTFLSPPDYQNALGSGGNNFYPKLNNPNFPPTHLPQGYRKTYDGISNQNNQYNFEQNRYQTPLGPPFEQNRYQNPPIQTKDFGIPPYRYNPETNADFQPLVELREIPFTISILPSHKALNLEANSIDNAKSVFQQDRNQFFPVSQDTHTKPPGEFFHSPGVPPGSGVGQPGPYPPKTAEDVDHAYRRVEDLKAQIYNLQRVIDGLNRPNHTQTLQDKETIVGLEKQIGDLRELVSSINPDTSRKSDQNHNHVPPQLPGTSRRRRRRTIENNEIEPDEDSQLYDQVASGLKRLIFEKENNIQERDTYDAIQRRIDHLRYQLESRSQSKGAIYSPILSTNIYQPPYNVHNQFGALQPKKSDAFTSLVVKIVEKLIAATPAVLEKLFGQGFSELGNFRGNENNNFGGQNDVEKLFKSLGVFGYGPLIFLRVVDGFATFVKILRRNEFFKNFLTPASILLLVAGAVVFLIWWLQPDVDSGLQSSGYYDYNESYPDYNYNSRKYSDNNSNKGYGERPSVYSGSYFDGDRRRGSFITR